MSTETKPTAAPGKFGLSAAVGVCVGLVVGYSIGTASSHQTGAPSAASQTSSAAPGSAAAVAAAVVAPAAVVAATSPSSWVYRSQADEMRSTTTKTACITSTNEVHLTPPYSDVTADLCIRRRSKDGLNIWLRLNGEGQFMCDSVEGCHVTIRFGDGSAERFSAIGPSDNSSNQIFLNGEGKVLTGLKRAPVTLVEAEFYEAGSQTIHFDTAGLKW